MVGERIRGLDGQSIGEQMGMFRQPGGMLEDREAGVYWMVGGRVREGKGWMVPNQSV
jgi:hypothetical protein